MKRKKLLPATLTLVLLFGTGGSVVSANGITAEQKTELKQRITSAYENHETDVDVSDLGILVNMYSDRLSEEYTEICNFCDELCEAQDPYIHFGNHKEGFMGIFPNTNPTANADEYDCGENLVTSITIWYKEAYLDEYGNVNYDKLEDAKIRVPKEYQGALDLIQEGMTDVEKALILYDFVISVSNYPDQVDVWEDGTVIYPSPAYDRTAVIRDHSSVCNSYAELYTTLLNDVGIPAVVVESTDMVHVWSMLKLDGTWYHADPTWDDPQYPYYTFHGYYSEDIWDIGAASHFYFLRSDEEFMENCGHYDWELRTAFDVNDWDVNADGITDTPVADKTGTFSSYIFGTEATHGIYQHYNYINGYWYFLDSSDNTIIKSKIDSSEPEEIYHPVEDWMLYVYSYQDKLYLCTDTALYQFDPQTQELKTLLSAESYGEASCFSEMNISSGDLNLVILTPIEEEQAFAEYLPMDEEPPVNGETIPEEDFSWADEDSWDDYPEEGWYDEYYETAYDTTYLQCSMEEFLKTYAEQPANS